MNCIFAYQNQLLQPGAVVSAAAENSNYPATNLYDEKAVERYWSIGDLAIITIDLSGVASPSYELCALINHNIPAGTTVTFQANYIDAWVSPAISQTMTVTEHIMWLLLDSAMSYGFARVVVASGSGLSAIKIGQLYLGPIYQPARNFNRSYSLTPSLGVIQGAPTPWGQQRQYLTHQAKTDLALTWKPERVVRDELEQMWKAVDGPGHPLLFIPVPDDADRLSYWCRLQNSLPQQYDYWAWLDYGDIALYLIAEPMPVETADEQDALPGDHADLALLLDPNDGVLKDQVSGSSFSFTRSTQGTYLHPDTGVITLAAVDEARFELIQGGKALLMEGQSTQHLLNSQVPATQTTGSLDTGTYILWCEGTGGAVVAAGTATITGAGTATEGAPVVFQVTAAGTVNVTVTGSLTFFQLEGLPLATSHIYSAGSATVRGADVCTLSLGGNVKNMLSLHEILAGLTPDATYASGVWADFSDASAFVLVDGQDISVHAGGLVQVIDSAGKRAWAWTKAALGSQTLSAELVNDNSFDGTCGVEWSCNTGWSIAGSLASKASGYAWANLGKNLYIDAKKLFRLEVDIQSVSGGELKQHFYTDGSFHHGIDYTTAGVQLGYLTMDENNHTWMVFTADSPVVTSLESLSIKQITSPGAAGLLCFKADRTTRGWAGEESGFNPNDIANARFYPAVSVSHAGTVIASWAPGFDPTDATADQNIFATDAAAAPLNVTPAGSLQLIDSAGNVASLDAFNWEAGGYYRLLAQWNFTDSKIGGLPAGKMRVGYMTTNGAITWLGTPVDYCGAMDLDGTLRLARNVAYRAHLGRLTLYSTVLTDDEVTEEAFK